MDSTRKTLNPRLSVTASNTPQAKPALERIAGHSFPLYFNVAASKIKGRSRNTNAMARDGPTGPKESPSLGRAASNPQSIAAKTHRLPSAIQAVLRPYRLSGDRLFQAEKVNMLARTISRQSKAFKEVLVSIFSSSGCGGKCPISGYPSR
ncbi:MAG: hypothetical protein ACOYYS_12060 [Chloroflexota bacterium]